MKKIQLIVSLLFCGGLVAGCATATASNDLASAMEAAESKRKEAAAMGAEWRDTGKMLKAAQKAADEGDEEKAMALVAKAHEQSEDAMAQFKREGELWQSRVPQ